MILICVVIVFFVIAASVCLYEDYNDPTGELAIELIQF